MFRNHIFPARTQQGSALVIAIFIIVVMSILAAVLVRVLITGSQATIDETYGARAFHAANSGAQVFLTRLISVCDPEDDTCGADQTQIDTSVCNGPQPTNTFSAPGLQGCRAEVECTIYNFTTNYNVALLRIESTGYCEAGRFNYSRHILVEVLNESM